MTEDHPARPPSLTPNQQARRQRIIDAALCLLRRRHVDRIQVRDVADEARVALGTVYHYFGSKEQLFAEALVTWAGTLGTSITRRPLAGTEPTQRLTEMLHRSVRAFERQPQLAHLVATLEVSSDPVAADVLTRLDHITTAVYLDHLADLEPDRAVRIVRTCQAVMASLLRSWSSGKLPAVEMHARLTEAVELLLGEGRGVPPG